MIIISAIIFLVSFMTTFLLMPAWIKKAKQIDLIWEDMNKYLRNKVAGSGGIIMVLGFIVGIFLFIAYGTFYIQDQSYLVEILSITSVVFFSAGIGLIDDLIGWKRGGLSRRSRLLLLALASIPLIVINAGRHTILIPFLGEINLGIIYPLIIIPLGVVGATSTFNFLAGFNGLESGQAIILISALGLVSFFTGNSWLAVISLCMVASLLAFLFYNFFPAKVFPGDALTYASGSLIAALAIVGNFEKVALFFFIPYILETFLKLKGKLIKQSFGKPNKDNSLELPYSKIYGLEHASIAFLNKINIKPTEKKVVYLIWLFQIIVVIIGFIIFREGIFN